MKCPICIYDTGKSEEYEDGDYLWHLVGYETIHGVVWKGHKPCQVYACMIALQRKLEQKWEKISEENWKGEPSGI